MACFIFMWKLKFSWLIKLSICQVALVLNLFWSELIQPLLSCMFNRVLNLYARVPKSSGKFFMCFQVGKMAALSCSFKFAVDLYCCYIVTSKISLRNKKVLFIVLYYLLMHISLWTLGTSYSAIPKILCSPFFVIVCMLLCLFCICMMDRHVY